MCNETFLEQCRPIPLPGNENPDGSIRYMSHLSGTIVSLCGAARKLKPRLTPPRGRHGRSYIVTLYLYDENGELRRHYPQIKHLIALTFIPNPENWRCVHCLDEDETNCAVENLRWATKQRRYCDPEFARYHAPSVPRAGQAKAPRPVEMLDERGFVIARFSSCRQAELFCRRLGLPVSRFHMRRVANAEPGQRRSGGYGWRWSESQEAA